MRPGLINAGGSQEPNERNQPPNGESITKVASTGVGTKRANGEEA